jgi:hypothetical protein
LWPEHGPFHAPHVDDVADQEQTIHVDVMQKIQQQLGAAAFEAQMNVRDKDRSQSQRRGSVTLNHVTPPRSLQTRDTFAVSYDGNMTRERRFAYKMSAWTRNIAWPIDDEYLFVGFRDEHASATLENPSFTVRLRFCDPSPESAAGNG